MRFLLSILFLLPLVGRAVEYPFIGLPAIETNGWNIRLTNATAPNLDATTAANTNLQFFNGFTTNNVPSATNGLTVTWTDMAYPSGVAGTALSVAYGTKLVRAVYPMHTTNDVQPFQVTNAVSRIALSRSIPSTASNITVSIRAGALASTNGAAFTNCMATNMSVALDSLIAPMPLGGNWSPGTPMFSRVTNTMRVRAIGFHPSAENRRPIELCRFITTGLTSGVKVTNDVRDMTVDHTYNCRSPSPKLLNPAEFIADVNLSGMTALEDVTTDLQMFPLKGNAILDTTTDTFPIGHPRECKLLNKYDPNNAHSRVIAVVDNVNGNDTNGRCATNKAPTDIDSSLYFLTAGAALNQAAASNNTFYSHNDTGGVIIYLKNGTTNYPGVNITATTIPTVAPILRVYPGDTAPVLTHVIAGSSASMKRIKFEGISTAWAASTVPFSAYGYLEFNQCPSLVSVSTAPIQSTTNVIMLHSTVGSFAQGLQAFVGQISAFSLRGCWLNGYNQASVFRTWMGNYHGDTNEGPAYSVKSDVSGDLSPDGNRILYGNYFGGQHSVSSLLVVSSNVNDVVVIVQNVFEKCLSSQGAAELFSTTAAGVAYTNGVFMANLVEGGRIADYGSDSGTVVVPHVGLSAINNMWAYPGQKDDTDGTPNANRWYGSAEPNHMVGCSGNFYIRNNTAAGATTAFQPAFAGLHTYQPGYTNVDNYMQFTDRKASSGGIGTLGGGDYRLLSHSPAFLTGAKVAQILPFDIEGKPRSAIDPPGPYTAGNRKKGAMF